MKTLNKFVLAAVVASLTTMGASKAAASPKGDDQQRQTVISSSESDVDTVHGRPMIGKGTPEATVVSEPGDSDTDTLRGIRDSTSAPKWKNDQPVESSESVSYHHGVKDADTNIVNEETMPEDQAGDIDSGPE